MKYIFILWYKQLTTTCQLTHLVSFLYYSRLCTICVPVLWHLLNTTQFLYHWNLFIYFINIFPAYHSSFSDTIKQLEKNFLAMRRHIPQLWTFLDPGVSKNKDLVRIPTSSWKDTKSKLILIINFSVITLLSIVL